PDAHGAERTPPEVDEYTSPDGWLCRTGASVEIYAAASAFAARLRWFASRMRLRRRSDLGVASTYSSASMYSIARSSDILSGASSCMPFPSPWLRILVRCLALHGLTGRSSGRAFSPTITPA